MKSAFKKARTWLLGGLLTLLGFSSCEKPGPAMYGPPLLMYGPPVPDNCQTRSAENPSNEELAEPVTPEPETTAQE